VERTPSALAWVLAVLRNRGPYPALSLAGEQGSAKSTFSAILRALLDPNTAPLRALPREDRDLFIAASNVHVLAFDNVAGLPAWISGTLCRLATGGGFAVRRLYTDQDETLFDTNEANLVRDRRRFTSQTDSRFTAPSYWQGNRIRERPPAESNRKPGSTAGLRSRH
jgi:hypothetical protein